MDFKELVAKAKAAGKLTDEQATQAEAIFGVEGLTKLISDAAAEEAGTAFAARKTELENNWNTANTEYLAMQEKVANHEATLAELTKAKTDLAAATEKLKTANPNIDLEKLTADITKVVSANAAQLELGARTMELDAIQAADDHRQLFGQSISVRSLVQEALAAKKPVMAYWEEKYNVAAKRTEVAKAAHDKEIADATEAGYKKRIAEEANPGTRALAPSKDPFWVPKSATEGQQPWDAEGVPPEEQALRQELEQARAA